MQMLSPTLNYSLTTRLHRGKPACKRSMAQCQQGLLSTRCEMEKTASPQQKKWRENCHFGACFPQRGMEIGRQKLGGAENPSHAWPSQKGMAIGQNVGLSRSPKLRGKAVSFLPHKNAEFREKKEGHTSTNRAKSVFLSLSPP